MRHAGADTGLDRRSRRSPGTAAKGQPVALIMSGGIGDYLHYLCRIDALLSDIVIASERVDVFVESTVPEQVKSLFEVALPEFRLLFVPAHLHWTKTNPLLDVNRKQDRINRPAYQFVASL